MKPNRNIWFWLAFEMLMAFAVHLLLRELAARGLVDPRAWWKKFSDMIFGKATNNLPQTPDNTRNPYYRN